MKESTLYKHLRANGFVKTAGNDYSTVWETADRAIRLGVIRDFGTVKRIDDLGTGYSISYPEAREGRNFVDCRFLGNGRRI